MKLFKHIASGVDKFIHAGNLKYDLNSILSSANPDVSLEERILWIQKLMYWIRSTEKIPLQFDSSIGQIHTARVSFILQLLDRNIEWKIAVSKIFRSVIQETSSLQLFCDTGLPKEVGFLQEATDRFLNKLIPTPPDDKELSELFLKIFPRTEDAIWVKNLTKETIVKIIELFEFQSTNENLWEKIHFEITEAICIIVSQIHAIGLSDGVRKRTNLTSVKESPFLLLNESIDEFLNFQTLQKTEVIINSILKCNHNIKLCRYAIQEVFQHLEDYGISVTLVYQLEKLTFHLDRLEVLLIFLYSRESIYNSNIIQNFISKLIKESLAKKSLKALIQTNLNQLSRKIAERAGKTGEHYITSNKKEYFYMFKCAAGGGIVTAFTTFIKFFIVTTKLPHFFEGFFASINYAASFVFIQLCGFTLATKQPSMTAAALAGKLHDIKESSSLNSFVDEITKLTRSQFSAILGNIILVVPISLLIDFLYKKITGHSAITPEKAYATIHSFSIFGPSIFYAIFTGFLLWFSSLAAGWIENWAVYRRLPEAIAKNKRLIFLLGSEKSEKISKFFANNISGFGGNISLGFMLGMTPQFGNFFGILLDIRHVTLASGSFAFALSALDFTNVNKYEFINACLGIIMIGILNVSVSFYLALSVAIRARKVQSLERKQIRVALFKRLISSPLEFLYPYSKK
ncbi:site-specific recombinase [Pigmentibacter sp. JX0631]|uniref:site-specific recombinase n=1 Tax=Pigmentibacter sp. JX0631 TaxID=2976982 RepID=UPI002468EEC3|nr:site-specific recombinase [Pigmentibacter sp. JX0631]WGL60874.1 site-specific recombinase [Pigmentibacter sp. JX0631]